jgi:hypothetical protein
MYSWKCNTTIVYCTVTFVQGMLLMVTQTAQCFTALYIFSLSVCSDMRHGRGVLISGAKDLIYEGDWFEV